MRRSWSLALVLTLLGLGLSAPARAEADSGAAAVTDATAGGASARAAEIHALLDELEQKAQALSQKLIRLEAERRELDQERAEIEALRQRLIGRFPETASARMATPVATSVATPGAIPVGVRAGAQAPGTKGSADAPPSPLSLRIGTAEFTPGGFLDFTSIFRSTNVGSGIGTAFGAIPTSDTSQGHLSESRFSAQNSRLSLRVTAQPSAQTNVTGYVETDFLGVQPANAYVTSNSNSLRLRLYWAQLRMGKWEVMAGQSWTMLTPNRVGLSPLPSDLFYSQNVDTNYQVGLTWSRDSQFRLIHHFNNNWTAGVSFENPEQYIGGAVVLPSPIFIAQLNRGDNLNTPNWYPDIISKVAFDGRPGDRRMHAEVAGLFRRFRIFNPMTNTHSRSAGAGVSANASLELWPNFRLILTSFYSDGGGRYIFGLGPDLIVRPDGTLSPVHAGSGIAGFEHQATPRWLWYGYYGGAYFQRNFSLGPSGPVGFGFPGSAASANRSVQEGTLGVIPTFWKKPEYGALQLITQYSYLTRSPWWTAAGAPKNAHAHLVYLNLRYTLP